MVRLGGPSGVPEYPAIPDRFAREFEMIVFDFEQYAGQAGIYCPGQDDLSASIVRNGIWDGYETVLALDVLTSVDGCLVDVGAHLGWYSLLAASCGRDAIAVEADAEVLQVAMFSMSVNGWGKQFFRVPVQVGPRTPPLDVRAKDSFEPRPVALWKIDIEGDEQYAIHGPLLGRARHILLEVSPCFNDSYPALLERIAAAGYSLYVVPSKPPASVRVAFEADPWATLRQYPVGDPAAFCAAIRQENVWCILND
jgi:hypothetical protein